MKTFYELVTLLPGTLTDEEAEKVSVSIRTVLEQHGAELSKHGIWEKRKLAYPINHVRQGIYLVTEFDMDTAELDAVEKTLRLDKSILRHLVTKAHRKTAKEIEQEARRRTEGFDRPATSPAAKPEAPAKELSKEELEEKLEEILKDDMTL